MAKKRSLADFDAPSIISNRLPLDEIAISPLNTRTYIDSEELDALAASMTKNQQIAPVIVRPSPNGSKPYELIAGKRRYLSARQTACKDIEAKILELNDRQACLLIREENQNRQAVNPIEDALSILNLLQIDTGLEVEEIKPLLYQMVNGKEVESDFAEQVENTFADLNSISLSTFVKDRLRLFNLPEPILQAIVEGKLDHSKGIIIARVKDESDRNDLLNKTLAESLSKEQIKAEVLALKSKTTANNYGELSTSDLTNKIRGDYARLSRSKKIWDNPKNRKKIERLARLMDELLAQ